MPVGQIGHDSTIHFAALNGTTPHVQTIALKTLPYSDLLFLSEECVVAVGHDMNPTLYGCKGGKWCVGTVVVLLFVFVCFVVAPPRNGHSVFATLHARRVFLVCAKGQYIVHVYV